MNKLNKLTIFLISLTGFQIVAMQQPNLRQQLIHAAIEGNKDRVEQLLIAGAPVAPEALYHPTKKGNYDIVRTIFECGVDPESPADPNQLLGSTTVFMHLVEDEVLQPQVKEKLIKLYLKHGADLEVTGPVGYNSLILAVRSLDLNTLKLLLEQGTYVKARDACGGTALMTLALIPIISPPATPELKKIGEQELKKRAELLIQYGADVNLKDNLGQTSLMYAVRSGSKIFVKLLLENNAKVNLEDIYGKSALDDAINKPEILELLEGAQATLIEKFIKQAIEYISLGI